MAAPPPVLTLAVEKGPRKGEIRQCRAGAALRVGRVVKGNDLAVRDVGASQQHLAIEFLPPPADRWAVSDLGSSNGTLLNGVPLVPSVPAPLSYGDLIKIGESTVLAVSIASDSDLNPGAEPGPRRSSRQAAAVVVVEEEKAPVVTRRGGRKKAAAAAPEIPEAENDEPDAAAVVVEEEKPRAVTRRGRRKKAAAAEPPEAMEEAAELTRCGGRKKAADPTEPQKEEGEEATVVTRRGGRKKTTEPPEPERDEEMEEDDAPVVTRHGRQKKAVEPPELEKGEEEQEEEAPVVTRRGRRKKDEATVAYLPLPPKARSARGRGRVTRAASTRKAVLEDEDVEEQEENEVAAPRERTGNSSTSRAVKSGEEKGDKVAVGDGEVEGTVKTLEEEVAKERASAHPAASDNGGEEEKGGGEEDDENGKREVAGCGGDGEKVEGRARRSCLETMTLREWFERMEKYLPRMIDEAADEMIAALDERHRCIYEYILMLEE